MFQPLGIENGFSGTPKPGLPPISFRFEVSISRPLNTTLTTNEINLLIKVQDSNKTKHLKANIRDGDQILSPKKEKNHLVSI